MVILLIRIYFMLLRKKNYSHVSILFKGYICMLYIVNVSYGFVLAQLAPCGVSSGRDELSTAWAKIFPALRSSIKHTDEQT